ncbi:MAG: hypothetical protein M1831_001909 [Alyxoria varia]|nr:MAG: hypothetical protein M1831_001909 [Alyxoria varia]
MAEASHHSSSRASPFSPPYDLVEHLRPALEADLDTIDQIHFVGPAPLQTLHRDPDAVKDLAHEKLYAYCFDQVPTCWRRCYEEASLWALLGYLERNDNGPYENRRKDWMAEALGRLDMIVIMTGAPGRRRLIESLLELLESCYADKSAAESAAGSLSNEVDEEPPTKKIRLSNGGGSFHMEAGSAAGSFPIPSIFPEVPTPLQPILSQPLPRLNRPSITTFRSQMHCKCNPVILTTTVPHWPALTRWRNPRYWMQRTHGGRRLVPVELGSSYTDEGWAQKIMPFGRFMEEHLLQSRRRNDKTAETQGSSIGEEEITNSDSRIGYVAQHDLLTQIPALRNDVAIPDYCYIDPLEETQQTNEHGRPGKRNTNDSSNHAHADDEESFSEPVDPLLNIWLGPANTVSPAHTDPHHNILVQVFGRKYVRLFAPEETTSMYPMGCDKAGEDDATSEAGVDMQNTSQVDVGAFVDFVEPSSGCPPSIDQASRRSEQPNGDLVAERLVSRRRRSQLTKRFPYFAEAYEEGRYVEAVLHPGECLYIPRGWWHYVRSLDISASVSFWWD